MTGLCSCIEILWVLNYDVSTQHLLDLGNPGYHAKRNADKSTQQKLIRFARWRGTTVTIGTQLPSHVPTLPSGLRQVFTYHQIPNAHKPRDGQVQRPIDPAVGAQEPRNPEPDKGKDRACYASHHDLFGGVVVEVDATEGDTSCADTHDDRQDHPDHEIGHDSRSGISERMAEYEEERQVNGKESDELPVG